MDEVLGKKFGKWIDQPNGLVWEMADDWISLNSSNFSPAKFSYIVSHIDQSISFHKKYYSYINYPVIFIYAANWFASSLDSHVRM